jgi:hypothetical protein
MSGFVGFDATPLGKPASVIWTAAVKPFWPATEMVIGAAVAPCAMETELEESVIVKSGEGAGGD